MSQNAAFVSHMSLEEANRLKADDLVDFKLSNQKSVLAKITMKSGTNLKITYNDWSHWCDYSTDLHRLATVQSISRRPAHRLQELKKGDGVDINPTQRHEGWKVAEIREIDDCSGQIQVPNSLFFSCIVQFFC